MRLVLISLAFVAVACGVRGAPRPPKPPHQPVPTTAEVEETPSADTTTLEQIR